LIIKRPSLAAKNGKFFVSEEIKFYRICYSFFAHFLLQKDANKTVKPGHNAFAQKAARQMLVKFCTKVL